MSKNLIKLICPDRNRDKRGFFSEIYNKKKYLEYDIDIEFVQDNHSVSLEIGTLRGMHFQAPPHAQAKLVRCGNGAIFDVAVDIRKGSPTFGVWQGYELSSKNGRQLYVPIGFAHGFVTLEPASEIVYKCSDYYAPETEGSVLWSDPEIGIDWPLQCQPVLSSKDATTPPLEKIENPFVYGVNS